MFIRIARPFIPYFKVWAFWISYVTEVIKEEIGKDKINNSEENNESNLNF